MDEVNVRRFMRHAMTNRIFREVNPDVVAHTAASRVLAEDDAMGDWVGFTTDDIFPVSETPRAVNTVIPLETSLPVSVTSARSLSDHPLDSQVTKDSSIHIY